jgi:hypothetical protein
MTGPIVYASFVRSLWPCRLATDQGLTLTVTVDVEVFNFLFLHHRLVDGFLDDDCMLTVLLVRHGETVHNVAKFFAGVTDSEYLLLYSD